MRFIVNVISEVGHGRSRQQMANGQVQLVLTPEQIAQIKKCVAGAHQRLPGEIVTISVALAGETGNNLQGTFHSHDLDNWLASLV